MNLKVLNFLKKVVLLLHVKIYTIKSKIQVHKTINYKNTVYYKNNRTSKKLEIIMVFLIELECKFHDIRNFFVLFSAISTESRKVPSTQQALNRYLLNEQMKSIQYSFRSNVICLQMIV